MKTKLLTAALTLVIAGHALGQASPVSLQNQESTPFYYAVDPKALTGLTTGSPLLSSRIADFLNGGPDQTEFATLAPGAEVTLQALTDGTHLLVGFYALQDQGEVAVRVLSLQADSRTGERFYAIFASPAELTVARTESRVARVLQPGATLAAQGAAGPPAVAPAASPAPSTAGLRTLAIFLPASYPVLFTRETKGNMVVLPIAQSRAWALTGTRIQSLSAAKDSGSLRLSLTVAGGFSENVSYFFYVFASRGPGAVNALTLELEPRASGKKGVCILWQGGGVAPRLIGSVSTTDTTVEVDIGADQLAPVLAAGDAATVDLTAGWFDRSLGTWEEFYYTTFAMAKIPVTR